MIGRIAGIILHRAQDHVLIDVRGVGYIVHVRPRTHRNQPVPRRTGDRAIYPAIAGARGPVAAFRLSNALGKGMAPASDLGPGVGAKVALAILGTLGPEGLARALALGDWSALRKVAGVGPKLAQRVTMELKDKAPAVMALGDALTVDPDPLPDADVIEGPHPRLARRLKTPDSSAQATADALSALGNLGYGPSEAARAVAEAAGAEPGAATPALIRAALRLLAPRVTQ